jgi:mycothiol synthase
VFRPMTAEDVDVITHIIETCELADDGAAEIVREDVASGFRRPGFDPASHGVVVLDGGVPVAWGEIFRRRAEADVLPSHRGRGIGAAILAWIEARARAAGVPRVGQTKTDADAAARDLFLSTGYEAAHTAWVLRVALDGSQPEPEIPSGIRIRTIDPQADARRAYRVIEDAFSELPGRDETPFELWRGIVDDPRFRADLSLVALDGDEAVGALIAHEYPDIGEGWVEQLATKASHRRRGIGRALLLTTFGLLRNRGRTTCGLSTDSRTGALALYERVGMRVVRSYTHYSKPLGTG